MLALIFFVALAWLAIGALLVTALSVENHPLRRPPGAGGSGDGGGGRPPDVPRNPHNPHGPRGASDEPAWWPEFERAFSDYVEQEQADHVRITQAAPDAYARFSKREEGYSKVVLRPTA